MWTRCYWCHSRIRVCRISIPHSRSDHSPHSTHDHSGHLLPCAQLFRRSATQTQSAESLQSPSAVVAPAALFSGSGRSLRSKEGFLGLWRPSSITQTLPFTSNPEPTLIRSRRPISTAPTWLNLTLARVLKKPTEPDVRSVRRSEEPSLQDQDNQPDASGQSGVPNHISNSSKQPQYSPRCPDTVARQFDGTRARPKLRRGRYGSRNLAMPLRRTLHPGIRDTDSSQSIADSCKIRGPARRTQSLHLLPSRLENV